MLDLPRYLLGVFELFLLTGFAVLGAAVLRPRLLPAFSAAPAHLATTVLALALLIWSAELLGTFGLFDPALYAGLVVAVGLGLKAFSRGWRRGGVSSASAESAEGRATSLQPPPSLCPEQSAAPRRALHPDDRTRGRAVGAPILIALAIAALAIARFALETKSKLSTGMTGFDSTWYHGPFAAGFFQSGSTWDLHFIAPQFLAWFYPANAEIFHAVGMLAFDRDLLSPLLNLGWLAGCLLACWCIGRPYGVGPWSLALGAIALSLPAFSDQAGEARNDVVGTFFLLAAVAIAIDAWAVRSNGERGLPTGALIVTGLAAGLAAGTKLNFLLPAAVLVLGLVFVAPVGRRVRSLGISTLAALAGGGYWYLRNLAHSGNPLPWFDQLGPISLPAPDQELGGREAHGVFGYLSDGSVWSDWFLPGLREGLTAIWPLLVVLALAGLVLCLVRAPQEAAISSGTDGRDRVLAIAALAGLAAVFAWLVAPTSASGPEGMPRGFESGLRYLAPALVLGLALLPATPSLRGRLTRTKLRLPSLFEGERNLAVSAGRAGGWLAVGALAAVIVGYPVQRHYLENRYAAPTFSTPGLDAAFKWARSASHARIATTSTRQYPLYGTDLTNQVQYIGIEQPHGGFAAPTTCRQWRRLLNAGDYDYAVTTRDRIEPSKSPYPPTAAWTTGPGAKIVLRKPPTAVFKLSGPLDPSACRQ